MSHARLRVDGRERVLLASCLGEGALGGGLFAYDGAVATIDALSSTGLATDGERLLRALWAPEDSTSPGELLTYDGRGVLRYLRIDDLRETHDVLLDGEEVLAVSTLTSEVLRLSPGGAVVDRWRAPGEGDAWHLNGLLRHEGRLLACAFGRFDRHREWSGDAGAASGVVFDLATGRDVLTGLSRPHHPRFADGSWLVCDSGSGELVQIAEDGSRVERRLTLQGWTRGLAVSDDTLFVGESAHRLRAGPADTATVAVVDRASWRVVARLDLPCKEVYDLLLVPADLVEGARRGFRTNALRVAESDQHALFAAAGVQPVRLWATGEPLPPEGCQVRIVAQVPRTVVAGAVVEVACAVENLGGAILVSAPPHPVRASYRWRGAGKVLEGPRTGLPRALPPGEAARLRLLVTSPEEPGRWTLHLTLVQEGVVWFDDVDPLNGAAHPVDVVGAHARVGTS